IIRTEEGLKKGLDSVDFALSICDKIHYDPTVSVYHNYSLKDMLTLGRACMLSALNRKETRGAHIRADFPETSEEFRRPTLVNMENGEIKITLAESTEIPDYEPLPELFD
ncbi:MAG: hypothetical protein HUJ75_04365, partial [Parasporobacterium sp.]|nr:hypothetical protein [Parasporobacterium sp.]